MTPHPRAAALAASAEKKAKRASNAAFQSQMSELAGRGLKPENRVQPCPDGGKAACGATSNRLKGSGGHRTGVRKRKKSPTLSKLKKLLWEQISLYVRALYPNCRHCQAPTQCAAHIVPSNDGAATRFFLPNIYGACFGCNEAERRRRGQWVYIHKEMFGDDFVDALYAMSKHVFQVKKYWVLEQIERIKQLRGKR